MKSLDLRAQTLLLFLHHCLPKALVSLHILKCVACFVIFVHTDFKELSFEVLKHKLAMDGRTRCDFSFSFRVDVGDYIASKEKEFPQILGLFKHNKRLFEIIMNCQTNK